MALLVQFTILITTSVIIIIGPYLGMAHIYERKVANGDCDIVLMCSFRQVPVRSKVHCAVLAMSLEDSGFYYNSSTAVCNICKPGPSATTDFTKINIDRGYFSKSKWKDIVGWHIEAAKKWPLLFRWFFLMYVLVWNWRILIHRNVFLRVQLTY